MLVKAKWNVRDAEGWHSAGEVWDAKGDLGDAVEVLEAPKAKPAAEPVTESESDEPKTEPKPRTSRRKVSK